MTSASGPDGIRPGEQMGRRYLSLWLPAFSLDRIERRLPAAEQALARATIAEEKGALRLVAVNRTAAALGLAPGLPFADARARHPALAVAPAAPAADAALLGRLADAGERYTPLIACDGPDGLMLDITGCAHLFGGERELVRDLLVRLRQAGFAARAVVAATAGAAFALARFGAAPAVVVPADAGPGPLLAPLPVAALRLDGSIVESLARLGLRRIGDIMDKPRAPLAARFGALVLRRLEEALGTAPSALAYRFPPPVFCAERRLMEPVERVEDVLGLAGHLAAALAAPLEQRGVGARRLDLVLFRVDGRAARLSVGARRPLRDRDAIVRLFAEKVAALGMLDAGFGFDLIRLAVTETAPMAAQQAGFGADDAEAALDGLIDRLAIRFGARRVRRLVCADHHLPEAAGLSVAAQDWSPPVASPDRPGLLPQTGDAIRPAPLDPCLARYGAGQVAGRHAGAGSRPGATAPEHAAPCDAGTGADWTIPPAGSGSPPAASLMTLADAGETQEEEGRDRIDCGYGSGASISEQADACDTKKGLKHVVPMRDGSGGRLGVFRPAVSRSRDAEAGCRQVVDSSTARTEDGPRPAGSFIRVAPVLPPLQSRLQQGGAGEGPVSPEGTAKGQILPFPTAEARSPDAGPPAVRPEASPAPELLHLRPLPDERAGSPAAGAAGEWPVSARADPQDADICGAARPLRLFTPPEPVEAVAEVPDGPPLRFRWRRRVHRVVRVEGPERIGGAWWTDDVRARDYFRIETEEGYRFWLFRTDPPNLEAAPPLRAPAARETHDGDPRRPAGALSSEVGAASCGEDVANKHNLTFLNEVNTASFEKRMTNKHVKELSAEANSDLRAENEVEKYEIEFSGFIESGKCHHAAVGTDAPSLAFPRPDHLPGPMPRHRDPGDGPCALSSCEKRAPRQGGRPGIWFLHGVLG